MAICNHYIRACTKNYAYIIPGLKLSWFIVPPYLYGVAWLFSTYVWRTDRSAWCLYIYAFLHNMSIMYLNIYICAYEQKHTTYITNSTVIYLLMVPVHTALCTRISDKITFIQTSLYTTCNAILCILFQKPTLITLQYWEQEIIKCSRVRVDRSECWYSYSRCEATEEVLSRWYSYSRSDATEDVISTGYLNVCMYIRNIVTVICRKM